MLRFVLKPVDRNQRDDESYLHDEGLVSVTVCDDKVIDGFESHVNATDSKITTWRLEILSRETLVYSPHVTSLVK